MRLTHFFIDRPRFATVLSAFVTLLGFGALAILPIAQYPEVVPPTVQITTSFPGASAETVARTVATPLEQSINGVENMLYMSSQSTGDGDLTITVTFRIGTDLNVAQMLTQNRVEDVLSRLPEDVQRLGVQVRKSIPSILLAIHLYSPDKSRDTLYLSNYATLHIKDVLARLPGVGDVQFQGGREYAMRIWIDPDKAAAYELSASDVLSALRAQNLQVSAGILNQPPTSGAAAYQVNVEALGRLSTPEQFADIILKSDAQGRVTRIRDIGRVEVGAADYGSTAYMDRHNAAVLIIYAEPGANSLAVDHEVVTALQKLKKDFPPGVEATIVYDPTIFIGKSIHEVIVTIFVATLLVVGVVFLFLQTWRATVIPVIAIPVSLVGTFTILAVFGISLNNLSLFGLVLAVGIVVDDAIVVVENVERNMRAGMSPQEAAHRTMDEVGGALIAIALTLCAVFVPSAFLSGISGLFFRQFAVTIAASTIISCLVSLTLSPALCAVLFKPHANTVTRVTLLRDGFAHFNRWFDRLSGGYGHLTQRMLRAGAIVLVIYGGLVGLSGLEFSRVSTGFIPEQDQGYLINVVQLPPGSTLERTEKVIRHATDIILGTKGVEHVAPFAGLDATTLTIAPNAGTIFSGLPSLYNHDLPGVTANTVLSDLRKRLSVIKDAHIITIPPPPVQGIGSAGGFKMMLEDRAGLGSEALGKAAQALVAAANKDPTFAGVFTLFNAGSPSVYADIDRLKAEKVGLTPTDIFSTLQVYLGSQYVNDFNYLGRTYQVRVQADEKFRRTPQDISGFKARSLQPVPGSRSPGCSGARCRHRHGATQDGGAGASGAGKGHCVRMDRSRLSSAAKRHAHNTCVRRGCIVRVPGPGGPIRELEAAIGDRADSADVPAGVRHWPHRSRNADRYPGADRLRRAGRAGRKKRHPDRRVCAAEGRARDAARRGRGPCRPHPPAADPDDVLLLHPGSCPAGRGDGRGRRNAPVARHGRTVRHDRRDLFRPAVHARVLHLYPQFRPGEARKHHRYHSRRA